MKTPHIHAAFPSKDMPYSRDDEKGITMRDYFAAKAMQGGIGLVMHMKQPTNRTVPEVIAEFAYEYADAMMEARDAG
jgi:hypothetical protein